MNFCHLKIVKTDKYFLNGGDFLKNQLIKHNKNFSHIQYEKNERRQQYIDSKRFVVRFRFYWRPPEGFYFHRRGFKKTLRRVIYIPLEGFRCPSWGIIIPLEGFSYPSWCPVESKSYYELP